jgi:heme/copper-type cytochrome/quinol oxidase subunit 2
VATFVGVALLLAACSGEQNALDPAGPYAQRPHDLIVYVFGIGVLVFVLVLLVFSLLLFLFLLRRVSVFVVLV